MPGYPVVATANAKTQVYPQNASGTTVSSMIVAAAKSGDNPGTMDATPTEAEVVALQETLYFNESDDVREVDILFSVLPTQTGAVQCVLARINGFDVYEDAQMLALYRDCIPVLPNIPQRIVSDVAITSITLVGAPSGVTSGVYTGNRIFITGRV